MGQSDIDRVLSALASDPSFQDTVVVCQDRQVSASRVVLALAFPTFLARVLGGREDKEMVVFIPDMLAEDVTARVAALFMTQMKNQPLHQSFQTNVHKVEPLKLELEGKSIDIRQETRNSLDEKTFLNKKLSPQKVLGNGQTLLHKKLSNVDFQSIGPLGRCFL